MTSIPNTTPAPPSAPIWGMQRGFFHDIDAQNRAGQPRQSLDFRRSPSSLRFRLPAKRWTHPPRWPARREPAAFRPIAVVPQPGPNRRS